VLASQNYCCWASWPRPASLSRQVYWWPAWRSAKRESVELRPQGGILPSSTPTGVAGHSSTATDPDALAFQNGRAVRVDFLPD
jgi:hypothetical protein